jgi:hypothetical protein
MTIANARQTQNDDRLPQSHDLANAHNVMLCIKTIAVIERIRM